VGLIRPITLNPFPRAIIHEAASKMESMLVVEMSSGQMLEDVILAGENQCPVEFFGRMGGVVPFPDEVLDEIRRVAKGGFDTKGHPRDRWLSRMQRNK
jgi:2-oxoglutarate ferredoxin oxidoreductase subunit alpha